MTQASRPYLMLGEEKRQARGGIVGRSVVHEHKLDRGRLREQRGYGDRQPTSRIEEGND